MAAMLVELSLYMGLAFPAIRERWDRFGKRLPWIMVPSAVVPYLIMGIGVGTFSWQWLGVLVVMTAVVALWFRLPRNVATDLGFLILMAGIYLSGVFKSIYPPPIDGLRIEVLGQLMWIRLGILAALLIRRVEGVGFGFLPTGREWWIGLQHFAFLMPLTMALMYGLEFARFDPVDGWWWQAPATFVGILWVVALGEEFFFRGLLQQWLTGWIGIRAGLVATAVLFGAVHLPFRDFPNWRFAVIAAVAGWFYGRAFILGDGIRAAMVTHALTVAAWRTLFR
jgi:membrane protease YdiL (CAAX protease family)